MKSVSDLTFGRQKICSLSTFLATNDKTRKCGSNNE